MSTSADTGNTQANQDKQGSTARTAMIVAGIIALTAVLLVASGFLFGWFEQPKYPTTSAPAEPNSRYEGTLHTEDGDEELIIRFFDDDTVTLTSPTSGRHSDLVNVNGTQYKEEVLAGDGASGTVWVLSIDGSDTLTVVHEDADGEFTATSSRGKLERTEWDSTDGEEGLAGKGPAA